VLAFGTVFLLVLVAFAAVPMNVSAESSVGLQSEIEIFIMNSPPVAPIDTSSTIMSVYPQSAVILNNVPTSRWTQGCSATSAGMLFGYYDRTGYPNMYTGPTNGGVCPLSELGQGKPGDPGYPYAGSCSIIATAQGFDGRTTRGHTDDYWISYNSPGPDPWEGHWTEHTWEGCTADFLGTNQWKWDFLPWPSGDGVKDFNYDGSTAVFAGGGSKLYDYIPPSGNGLPQTALCHGLRLFAESRGYTVITNYNQKTDNQVSGGFSFAEFQNEINNGYPVLIQVVGHTMIGIGYNAPTSTIYLHDTWDNSVHTMTWGGSYAGMQMLAMTVFHLAPINNPPIADANGPYTANEGSSVTFDASGSYDPDGDTLQYRWDFNNDAIWDTSYSTSPTALHTWNDDHSGTVVVEVYDGKDTDTDSTTVTINNVPPTLTLSGPGTVDEGGLYLLTLSSSDPGDDTISHWTISWNDGITTTVPGDPTLTGHIYVDGPDSHTISATATDEDGTHSASNTVAVSVSNLPPVVTAIDNQLSLEGTALSMELASFSDQGTTDTHSASVNWGDSTTSTGSIMGSTVSGSHTYSDDGVYTVTITVTDSDGGSDSDSFSMTVGNVAPTLTLSGDTTVAEGASYQLTLSSNDPGDDTITQWDIDWDDSTTAETIPGNPSLALHTYVEGPNSYTISGSATDEDGTYNAGNTISLSVLNAPPVVSAVSDQTVNEGSGISMDLAIFNDPGMMDTHTATINWGDSTIISGIITSNYVSGSHTYQDNGVFTTGIIVTDDDGDSGSDFIDFNVLNVAPIVIAGSDQCSNIGDTTAFSGSFMDPGALDTHTIHWNFGDGGTTTGTLTPTHIYTTYDEFTVTLTVTDDDGGVGVDTLKVTVGFSGGDGTPTNPYQISNVYELQNIKYDTDAHYIVVNDIDASVTSTWNSGAGFEPINGFKGSLNGDGFEISELYIDRPTEFNIGLFGSLSGNEWNYYLSGPNIKDLNLVDIFVEGSHTVGGLIGNKYYGYVSNCFVSGTVIGNNDVGGLTGVNEGWIIDSNTDIEVTGSDYVGGLVGFSWDLSSPIYNSHSAGTVNGNNYVGGIIGYYVSESGILQNCYSTCDVNGNNYVGGLAGLALNAWYMEIVNSYSTGDVSGNDYVGGLIGYVSEMATWITGCYSTSEVSGNNYVGGLIGSIEWNAYLRNSYASGNVIGDYYVGGLIGTTHSVWIGNLYSTGNVEGIDHVGGLIGEHWRSSVTNSYSVGYVTGTNDVGGLIGTSTSDGYFNSEVIQSSSFGDVTGTTDVGGLIGNAYLSTITDTYSHCSVTGTNNVGGLIGLKDSSTLKYSYSSGYIVGTNDVGGLIGKSTSNGFIISEIQQSISLGDVYGTNNVGGLVGNAYLSTITDTYSHCSVSGHTNVGGLIGLKDSSTVTSSYSAGSVSGTTHVGGLIGYGSSVTSSYWDIETSGQTSSSSGTGKTTTEMMQKSTYVGWDFVNIWQIYEGQTYPFCQWQNIPPIADAGGPYGAYQGMTITFDASGSYDIEGGTLQYRWDFDNDGTWDTSYSTSPTATYSWTSDHSGTVKVEVSDGVNSDTDTAEVVIKDFTTVYLLDSTGAPLSGGIVKYYKGGWQAFGTTDETGCVSKAIPAGTYGFRMIYESGTDCQLVNVGSNSIIIFQTKLVTLKLMDSNGDPLDTGTAEYSGTAACVVIGDTSSGQVTKEILPGVYNFKMTYEGRTVYIRKVDINVDPVIEFQTTKVTLKLVDGNGDPMDTGTAEFWSSCGWQNIGDTSSGEVTKELFSGKYHFRMTYAGSSKIKYFVNIGLTPIVIFQFS
jgi:hypothetical protein